MRELRFSQFRFRNYIAQLMCYANSDETFPNKTVLFDILAFQADTNKQKVSPCRFTTSACALNMYFMVAVTQNIGSPVFYSSK